MMRSNDLIIAILIYEMNVIIKKIKENVFKKNIAFHDKYICIERKISGNAVSKLKIIARNVAIRILLNSTSNIYA